MKQSLILALALVAAIAPAQVTFQAFGADAASIQATVDSYRAALGPLNPNQAGVQNPNGRREINWDGVPDAQASPNNLKADFFNTNSPRGAVFTGASAFRVSADDNNPTNTPTLFADLNPDYAGMFRPFSQQRLFSAMDSTTMSTEFFVAGSTTAGLTRGFGAVFTDVDMNDLTKIEYFDASHNLLHTSFALGAGDFDHNQTLSFVGVLFDAPIIASVRITSGNVGLGGSESFNQDVVVMDDFIYGEVVPEPASLLVAGLSFVAVTRRKRKRGC